MDINFYCIIAWLWRYTKFAFMVVHKHWPQMHIMADIFKVLSKTKSLKLSMMGVCVGARASKMCEAKFLGSEMTVIIKGNDNSAGVYNHGN